MKVKVYLSIKLTGLTEAGATETKSLVEMVSMDASFPALPRPGNIVELHGSVFAEAKAVEQVNWFPNDDKNNVFFPVIYLEEDDSFSGSDRFSSTTTLVEKTQSLKRLVGESQDHECFLNFSCNA